MGRHKKSTLLIKEQEASYVEANKQVIVSKASHPTDLFFNRNSIQIYNANILKTESIKKILWNKYEIKAT